MPGYRGHMIGGAVAGVGCGLVSNSLGITDGFSSVFLGTAVATASALLPDIDTRSKIQKIFNGAIVVSALTVLSLNRLDLDFLSPLKMVSMNDGVTGILGVFIIAIYLVLGRLSPHRQFTHKIIGIGLFFVGALLLLDRQILWFSVAGFLSHIVLDMFTPAGLKVLDIKLPLQDSHGKFGVHF